MGYSYKRAFTLSEVLITLMIIGVVAAMTIPTLMQTFQDYFYKIAYKKPSQKQVRLGRWQQMMEI